MYIYIYVCKHIFIYLYIYIYIFIHMYVYIHTCIFHDAISRYYIYIYIYIHMYYLLSLLLLSLLVRLSFKSSDPARRSGRGSGARASGCGAWTPGPRSLTYTQSPLQDSRLFGPSPWKILAATYEPMGS